MARQFYTFAQLKAAAEHAISGSPDSRTPTADLVNDALEYLWNVFAWSWRAGRRRSRRSMPRSTSCSRPTSGS